MTDSCKYCHSERTENIRYVYVKQEITIPVGTPIDLNFDWYGPAKMAELYGAN